MSFPSDHPDDLLLPRQPGVIRQFWARHPRLADWLIALFWGFPALLIAVGYSASRPVEGSGSGGGAFLASPGLDALLVGLAVCAACSAFFLRRTRPILAMCVFSIAVLPAPFTVGSAEQVLPVFGIYSLAVYRSSAAVWIAAVTLETVSSFYVLVVSTFATPDALANSPVQWVFVYGFEIAIALLIGTTVGGRRRYLAALIDRAHQLGRERDQQAQLSAAAERARIARDMHDVVSHSLTVMVTLAEGSALTAETDATRAAAVMRKVADTGREALTGMRQMLGVLGGDEDVALAPQPTAAELPQLVAQFRGLGVPVELQRDGDVPDEPALQLAVYRVVQEGLTNALRYAHGPTRVAVRVDATGDPVAVVIEDDGLPGIPTPSIGAGRGLIGLAERVHALGGTLTTGPRTDGAGWRVAAALPLSGKEKP